jgi:hypothetical protein
LVSPRQPVRARARPVATAVPVRKRRNIEVLLSS